MIIAHSDTMAISILSGVETALAAMGIGVAAAATTTYITSGTAAKHAQYLSDEATIRAAQFKARFAKAGAA